jgi:hypothetical protein
MVKKLGGHCVKIIREAVPVLTDDADTALAVCTEWDLIVDNDGDKKELHRKSGNADRHLQPWSLMKLYSTESHGD